MKILSIYFIHNATVGVFEDGRCLDILHEEKFSNKKNHLGWPHRALEYLSKKYDFSKFDYVAITSEQQAHLYDDRKPGVGANLSKTLFQNIFLQLAKIYLWVWYKVGNLKIFNQLFKLFEKRLTLSSKKEIENLLLEEYKIPKEKILYVNHHFSHVLTPYYFYGLQNINKDFLFITMDGIGDDEFSTIYEYKSKSKNFNKIASSSYTASLGLLYAELTSYLGMKPTEHEYKVMGLAAYVSSSKYYENIYSKLRKIIHFNPETLEFNSTVSMFSSIKYYMRDNFVGERFDNVAAAVQKLLEDLVCEYISAAIKKTGIKNIVVSGGVFMNVKLNKKIMELDEVKQFYIQPSGGDESTIIGNAAKVFIEKDIRLVPIESMYFGLKYSNEEVKEFIKLNK